ncbi:MAG: purine-binding chemotaxis protein CheW [Bradymonadia bacterium]
MTVPMRHVCLFRVSDILMCLPIEQVQQVFESAEVQFVPLAPPAVLGLVNLRGLVVTAIDLRTVLQLGPSESSEVSNIVTTFPGRVVSLRVDEVISVEEVEPGPLRPPPQNLAPALQALARGVLLTTEGIALLADVDAIALAMTARPNRQEGVSL